MINGKYREPLFLLGQIVVTPDAISAMYRAAISPLQLLLRHQQGDWGDLDAQDRASNDRAIAEGARILSAYTIGPSKEKVWVISEWDRSATTILCPSEY